MIIISFKCFNLEKKKLNKTSYFKIISYAPVLIYYNYYFLSKITSLKYKNFNSNGTSKYIVVTLNLNIFFFFFFKDTPCPYAHTVLERVQGKRLQGFVARGPQMILFNIITRRLC